MSTTYREGSMQWEIIDDNGVVYSGSEDEMRQTFNNIVDGKEEVKWTGDLKLVQVHAIHR